VVRPFTILLVEDDIDVREALADALSDKGYLVECAVDGEQALQVLRAGARPGLILLDLMMPRMNGAEFRTAQRADPALAALPVVLLSADARMDEKAQALKVEGAVRKPIDLDQLCATIERIRGAVSKTSA
jgi:two-component system, chemotaxis family, chemotaxis protein CheY